MFSPTQRKRIDGPLRELTGGKLYYAYELNKDEYVWSTPADLEAVVEWLTNREYEQSPRLFGIPLEAAKLHHETGNVHAVSLRRVDPDNPARQWHVHLFEVDGVVDVYSHYEYRPDMRPINGESVGEAIDRLKQHKRPSWGSEWGNGVTYVLGDHCDVVADFID